LAIFYLGLLPSSRLFGGDNVVPHLSPRYLYVAAAGLMVVAAYALSYLHRRFDRLLAAAPVLLALLVLMPTTWAQNADWADEITLFESDYRRGARSGTLRRLLTAVYLKNSDFPKVIEICDANRNEQGRETYDMFTLHCASAQSYSGRHAEAERPTWRRHRLSQVAVAPRTWPSTICAKVATRSRIQFESGRS
jgi:hypothetical protein